MARDRDEQRRRETAHEHEAEKSPLDRRSYLKFVGGALATSGAVGYGSSRSSAAEARTLNVSDGEAIDPYLENISDGETVKIPKGTYAFYGATISANNWEVIGQGATFDAQGDTVFRPSGSGWTFGGIDFAVESGNVRALPQGGDWTLHNCAWNGPNTQGSPLVRPYVASGTEATIDACWFGDGMGVRVGESAIKGNSDGDGNYSINGDLYVKRCYFWQNTCYAAASADPGQPGRVHFDSCYFQDAYLAGIRTGSLNGPCHVRNCVINLEDISNVPETSSGVTATRGIWAYWGEVVVENTDIYTPGHTALLASSTKDDAAVTARDCQVVGGIGSGVTQSNVGSDPSRTPPDGCVTSPEEAYLDETSTTTETDSTSTDYPHVLSIVAETSDVVNYEFTVTEQARKSTARGATIDSEDQIDDGTITGTIAGGTDSYEFGGKISSFTIDGRATVYLDGSQVAPSDLTEETSDSPEYSGKLVIDGTANPRQVSTYEFTVDGAVKKSSQLGSINSFDSISNNTVSGRVINGKDGYEISGEIVNFKIDGRATLQYEEG